MRLPTETPAQQALQESIRPTKRPPGNPKTTQISRVNQDLKEEKKKRKKEDLKEIRPKLYLSSQALQTITQDRDQWRHLTKSKSAVPTNGRMRN